MQNKVYLKDLSVDEIMQRLSKGEKVYEDDHYLKLKCNTLCEFDKNDKVIFINRGLFIDSDDTKYFLDDVKEPEADGSCVSRLCKFWNSDKDIYQISMLTEITKDDHQFIDCMGVAYNHCQPLCPEEVRAITKE